STKASATSPPKTNTPAAARPSAPPAKPDSTPLTKPELRSTGNYAKIPNSSGGWVFTSSPGAFSQTHLDQVVGMGVPQPGVVASGGEEGAVGAERRLPQGVAGEDGDQAAGVGVPQPRGTASGGQGGAVGAERHPPDNVGVAGQGGDQVTGTSVPQPR